MENSFQPQWKEKKFSFPSCQLPVCGMCGNVHPNVSCFAYNRKYYRCHRIGHIPNVFYTDEVEKGAGSSGKKTRDIKWLSRYLENQRVLRELPFSSLRHNQFHSLFDTLRILRTELYNIKIQLRMSNQLTKSMTEKLRSAESEIARIQSEYGLERKKYKKTGNVLTLICM